MVFRISFTDSRPCTPYLIFEIFLKRRDLKGTLGSLNVVIPHKIP
jgi:hypothetical protein